MPASEKAPQATPISHTVFKFFFASHIPPTLFLDASVVLPPSIVPSFCTALRTLYTDMYKDPLFISPPIQEPPLVETFLQLPFFIVALYAFHKRKNWIRVPAICYAAHTATTLVPILTNHMLSPDVPSESRAPLVCMFLPYLLIPLWLMFHCARNEVLFPDSESKNK
eukprot:CAMPEP_0206256650 /NCGR_PEP_ID=MMETSP0047_2-20121206/24892_1 /ASSEMBLY_ACC=CAM_ASM_000192 /TAXON_ID=195065 /ORGANISM="Chroomonas mesostigmatica_cf, Strain CCMP1168" /LENGTH=166 /DNA_ID=CAMNT_0053683127 /DNA_START=58 /DNA_END=559 /DNA_ORIENTATION=+